MSRAFLAALLGVFLCAGNASARDIAGEPMLRIETGAHGADVPGLASFPDGRRLVSASLDKTMRIWSPGDRDQPPLVLRVPAETSREGILYTVAVSPNGRTIATGGWTGEWDAPNWSVYLFNADTAAMERRIGDLPHRVLALAFSPDGTRLAMSFKDRHGVAVYDTATWTLAARDDTFRDDTTAIHFGRDGRLVAVSLDGSIRIYDRDFQILARGTAPGGTRPYVARFAPDGQSIALSYLDSSRVDLLSASDLSLAGSADNRGAERSFTSLDWSADGAILFGGGLSERGGRFFIRRWTLAGRGPFRDVPIGTHAADRIVRHGDGQLAFATTGGGLGLLDGNGRIVWERKPAIPDFRDQQGQFKISADGSMVEFASDRISGALLRHSIRDRSLVLDPPADDLTFAALPPPDLELAEWREHKAPLLNGRPLALRPHENAIAAAAMPDGKGFAVATGWRVISFTTEGEARWDWQAPDVVWAINVSRDGRLVVVACGDGTIRWLRRADGAELATLFVHGDRERWAAWTPDGAYMASAGGDTLIGWHVNQGKDTAAAFFTVGRFRDRFYRPDAVEHAVLADGSPALQRRGDATPVSKARDVAALLPPSVVLLSPRSGAVSTGPELKIEYELRNIGPSPADLVRVTVNRRPVAEQTPPTAAAGRAVLGQMSIPAPDGDAIVEVQARNALGIFGDPSGAWVQAPAGRTAARPNLYIAAIGISDYAAADLRLGFAAKDAQDFTSLLRRQQGRGYGRVDARLLTDREANAAGIADTLRWLATAPGPDDVAILFMAGHGVDTDSGYRFVAYDTPPGQVEEQGLSYAVLQRTLGAVAGRAFLFLDTCQSGAAWGRIDASPVDTSRIVNDLASPEQGVVVFASSSGRLLSYESAAWGNGAFTKAVVEGLSGNADLFRNGYVTTSQLDAYVSDRVRRLTGEKQKPASGKPVNIDFRLVDLR
jgi:WD40 repeat protein